MDSIDKFGRHLTRSKIKKSVTHSLLTNIENNFDFKNKRLCRVQSPVAADDCANKGYVDKTFDQINDIIKHSKLPYFDQVKQFAQLQVDCDDLKRSVSTNTHSITHLSGILQQVNVLTDSHSRQIDKLTPLEKTLMFSLDAVEEKLDRKEASLKKLLTQLETKINKKIDKLKPPK